MPEVTVVVPTRNRRDVLALTLGSVLGQVGVDLEVVIVDEGSSDGTSEALEALAERRIAVVRHDEPKGVAAARNAGIERATAPWVAFCDDDDVWAPDKLRAQLDAIAAVPGARWACAGSVSIDGDRAIIGHQRAPAPGDHAEVLRMGNVIPAGGSSVLMATALARELGGFDPWPTGVEDYDLWLRAGQRSPLASVDRPMVGYRIWPGSMSTNVDKMRTGRARVVERHRGVVDPARTRPLDLRHRQYLARFHLKNRDRLAGFRDYLDIAVRYRQPTHVVHAAGALLAPGVIERRRARRERAEVPAWWAEEANGWLQALRPVAPVATS